MLETFKILRMIKNKILYVVWSTSLVAVSGSLFFSEGLHFPPCVLCWYQRVAMYPLFVILTVGILRKDRKLYQYVLPFSILGLLVSIYHNLLYYGILPESAQPCTLGISCTTKQIELFGFITIPLMSLLAFVIINLGMFVYAKGNKK